METLLSVCLGIGLAAACGFRVFVPFLLISIAAKAGHLSLDPMFAWVGTWPALITFAVATVAEILAYYVPWVDNVLDTAAAPIAVVAGTVITASVATDITPWLKWTLAVIAGGGAAGLTQAATMGARWLSTTFTGGLGNWAVNTIESIGAFVMSLVAMLLPLLVLLLLCLLLAVVILWLVKRSQPRVA